MLQAEYLKYKLNFKFKAGTSRGVLEDREIFFVRLFNPEYPDIFGLGECAPLTGLSPESIAFLDKELPQICHNIRQMDSLEISDLQELLTGNVPALKFAIEMAILDLKNGGERALFSNGFYDSGRTIPINGLVWMGDRNLMLQRLKEKIEEGFNCIKIKIGAIDFQDELNLIKFIRSQYSKDVIQIRADANGAFEPDDALDYLEALSKYQLHSVEQPIKARQWKAMEKICRETPVPVALDEELIGLKSQEEKMEILDTIRPQYITLKPTLVGGLVETSSWIELAVDKGIGWWITSALESNIGLNAIAQFCAGYQLNMHQGLGTGQLFTNNIPAPLKMEGGFLSYDTKRSWDLSLLNEWKSK